MGVGPLEPQWAAAAAVGPGAVRRGSLGELAEGMPTLAIVSSKQFFSIFSMIFDNNLHFESYKSILYNSGNLYMFSDFVILIS